jgi:hypothetical protein
MMARGFADGPDLWDLWRGGEKVGAVALLGQSRVTWHHFHAKIKTCSRLQGSHRSMIVLDDEGHHRIVEMMWEIIYVDGSVNEFEDNMIWRAADLLGVPSRQRIELRQRIAADGAALAPMKCSATVKVQGGRSPYSGEVGSPSTVR